MPAIASQGPYYEDFSVGEKIVHAQGRTITDVDNIWFSLLTCNNNQIHYNRDYTERVFSKPPFEGRLVVNSMLVFSIVLGLSVGETSKNGIMLGVKELSVSNPTFSGDTLYAETEVIDKRESKTHESTGLVTVLTKGLKQDGVKVIDFQRTFMVLKTGKTWE